MATTPFTDQIDYDNGFPNIEASGFRECSECGSEREPGKSEGPGLCQRCDDIIYRPCLNCGKKTHLYDSESGMPFCSLVCWAQLDNGRKLAEYGLKSQDTEGGGNK